MTSSSLAARQVIDSATRVIIVSPLPSHLSVNPGSGVCSVEVFLRPVSGPPHHLVAFVEITGPDRGSFQMSASEFDAALQDGYIQVVEG